MSPNTGTRSGRAHQPASTPANTFPPGLRVRQVRPTDNEAVRQLFIESQNGLLPEDATREVRIAMKKYTDSCLMSDLARASTHYTKPGRRMWILESQQREIVAMAAVDMEDGKPEVGLLRRLCVAPGFRRKGVATLLSQRAEQWAAKQGFSSIRLYASELQPEAKGLHDKLEYAQIATSNFGPLAVVEMEKRLEKPVAKR